MPSRWVFHTWQLTLAITLNSAQRACWTGFYVRLLLLCNAVLGCPNTSPVTHCGYSVTPSRTVPGTIFSLVAWNPCPLPLCSSVTLCDPTLTPVPSQWIRESRCCAPRKEVEKVPTVLSAEPPALPQGSPEPSWVKQLWTEQRQPHSFRMETPDSGRVSVLG